MRKKRIKTAYYQAVDPKIPKEFEGFRIAVISDLHDCCIGEENTLLIRELKMAEPDVILTAGDMITEEKMGGGVVSQEHAAKLLEQLPEIADTYYGMGNHEQRWKEIERPGTKRESFEHWCERLRNWRIHLLDNESVEIIRGGESIRVTGLALPNRFYNKRKLVRLSKEDILGLVGAADSEHFQLLIGHSPQFYRAYMDWGADAAFAGHYHGGVIRLPFLGGVISTNFRLFPKYDYGAYYTGRQQMIVTSGLGCHTIPIRLWNPPEVVILELKGEAG